MGIVKFNDKILNSKNDKTKIFKTNDSLEIKCSSEELFIPILENGAADLTNAEFKVSVFKNGLELFPNYDDRIPGRNYVRNSKGPYSVGGITTGDPDTEVGVYWWNILYANLKQGNTYTFSSEADAMWNNVNGVHGAQCYIHVTEPVNNFIASPPPRKFIFPVVTTNKATIRTDSNKRTEIINYWNFKIEEGDNPNPVWTPAPEEILSLAKIISINCSAVVVNDTIKITSINPDAISGSVNFTINYGDNLKATKRINWKKKDGIIAEDISIRNNEEHIPIEVWQNGKMLFPEYDESVPGRNLILNSILQKQGSTYNVAYLKGIRDFVTGEKLAVAIIDGITRDGGNFELYSNRANIKQGVEERWIKENNIAYANFSASLSLTNVEYKNEFGLYIRPNIAPYEWSIYRVIIISGTDPVKVWTPAPEELLDLATIHPVNCSYRIENNEIVLYDFKESKGYIDIEISYGDNWVRKKRINFVADFHEKTIDIFKYAKNNGYTLPTNQFAYDEYIRGLIDSGIYDKLDLHYIFSGDGDTNFKLINVVSPGVYKGVAQGGLEWMKEGVMGNGINGRILSGFELLNSNNYQLTDASKGFVADCEQSTGRLKSRISASYGARGLIQMAPPTDIGPIYIEINGVYSTSNPEILNMFSRKGFISLSRVSETDVNITSKDSPEKKITSNVTAREYAMRLLEENSAYSDALLYMYFIGASLTYEETQIFRELFNKYLENNNLEPIA